MSFHQYLAKAQLECGRTDAQLAEELGFSRANVYAAISAGNIKMPAGKLLALATALNASPAEIVALYLADVSPDLLEAVRRVWGPATLADHERKLIEAHRALTSQPQTQECSHD